MSDLIGRRGLRLALLSLLALLGGGARTDPRFRPASGRPYTPRPPTVGPRFGYETTQIPFSTVSLFPHHPPEHVTAFGQDLALKVDGALAIFSILSARGTYGPRTGAYLILGGFDISWGETAQQRTVMPAMVFEGTRALTRYGRDDDVKMIVMGLELPGAGVRAVGKVMAGSLALASHLSWYEYGGVVTRLADGATSSVMASGLYLSVSLDAQLCFGQGISGRYAGACLFGAPIIVVWSPGDPPQYGAGATFGFRIAIM
jgi:hypothetical protein